MKNLTSILLLAAASLLTPAGTANAQTITPIGDLGQISELPGSSSNYDFLAQSGSTTDTGTGSVGTFELTDFSVSSFINIITSPGSGTSVIPPGGSSPVQTGVSYSGGNTSAAINLTRFTLSDVGPTPFNYANFDVFVMYSTIVGNAYFGDADIALASGNDATGMTATVIPVTDTNTDTMMGRVVEFNIQGASAGDVFTLAASPSAAALVVAGGGDASPYLSGISFQSVPEPSTWALVGLGGLVLIGSGKFRKFRA